MRNLLVLPALHGISIYFDCCSRVRQLHINPRSLYKLQHQQPTTRYTTLCLMSSSSSLLSGRLSLVYSSPCRSPSVHSGSGASVFILCTTGTNCRYHRRLTRRCNLFFVLWLLIACVFSRKRNASRRWLQHWQLAVMVKGIIDYRNARDSVGLIPCAVESLKCGSHRWENDRYHLRRTTVMKLDKVHDVHQVQNVLYI